MIYFLYSATREQVKIGTTKKYKLRHTDLTRRYGDLTLLGWMNGDRKAEQRVHKKLEADRVEGEWFKLSPAVVSLIDACTQKTEPPSPPDDAMVRVSYRTQILLNVIKETATIRNGRHLNIDEALWQALEDARPEEAASVKSWFDKAEDAEASP